MDYEAYAEKLDYLASRAAALGDGEVSPPALNFAECCKVASALRYYVAAVRAQFLSELAKSDGEILDIPDLPKHREP
ncbi:hypothetical protein [Roseixanthobacter pseudopolyaromaticivorans]|uniref:hypothetical protein n=1 Tax=Xanthobacteraceae TaxID=335928 RepID=UPI00372A3E75